VEAFKTKVLNEIWNEGKLIEEECLSKLYEICWKSLEDYDPLNKYGATFFTHLYGRLKWVAPRARSKIVNNMWYKTTTSLDYEFENID